MLYSSLMLNQLRLVGLLKLCANEFSTMFDYHCFKYRFNIFLNRICQSRHELWSAWFVMILTFLRGREWAVASNTDFCDLKTTKYLFHERPTKRTTEMHLTS